MRYKVIPRVLIFLFAGEEILLIQRSMTTNIFPGRYNGVGGHVEHGETPWEAARRELKEESGIAAELSLCGLLTDSTNLETGVQVFIYRADLAQKIEPISSDEGAVSWIPYDQIFALPLMPDLPMILPKIKSWKTGDMICECCVRWESPMMPNLRIAH